ncbi:glycosyltransferase [Nodosilinea sp. PGN35]|uniref:glycosyltransferase n=1 Tax=Nodosilinea sp. PGN35 TaxID=3020489 RepID=UPI0023B335BE|nr:glycosyltransferase [Nodosilinea sp. TSF1-S3]MDF0368150.1 glycosyltransferase [Nodosilinea sp. TSF1-S3]
MSRVAHVLNGLDRGGTENLCLQLIVHSPNEADHVLINLDAEKLDMLPKFQQISNLKIINISYKSRSKVGFILTLTYLLWREKLSAILIQPFGIHVLVGLAARLAVIKRAVAHAGNPAPFDSQSRQQWKHIIQASRFLNIPIHACSQATHNSLQRLAQLPRYSFPIPNGCDVEDIAKRSQSAQKKRIDSDTLVIGMVARLDTIKDQKTLIQAFSQLFKNNHRNIELWLVGEGSEKNYLKQLCDRLDLGSSVKFLGTRPDVPELLGQMDIYAFSTSEAEGFGIALIEAMAASLPIVASDVAACREVLDDGQAGALVTAEDVAAMAKALEVLLLSADERQRWGQLAYSRAAGHYSIQTCAQRWYGQLLNPGVPV